MSGEYSFPLPTPSSDYGRGYEEVHFVIPQFTPEDPNYAAHQELGSNALWEGRHSSGVLSLRVSATNRPSDFRIIETGLFNCRTLLVIDNRLACESSR